MYVFEDVCMYVFKMYVYFYRSTRILVHFSFRWKGMITAFRSRSTYGIHLQVVNNTSKYSSMIFMHVSYVWMDGYSSSTPRCSNINTMVPGYRVLKSIKV